MIISKALALVTSALNEDPEYFYLWQANIAVQFQDAIYRSKKKHKKKYLNRQDIHKASNEAAMEFLKLLCRKR